MHGRSTRVWGARIARALGALGLGLAFGLALAACDDAPPEVPPLQPGWNVFTPGGDTICANGGEYAYFVSPGTVNKLLIEFEGGGACWNALTCAFPQPEFPSGVYLGSVDVPQTLARLNDGMGIYDSDNPANPFRDWYHVFISYCSGDVHYGDNVVQYTLSGRTFTIHHKGRVNAQAALDWTFRNFGNPEAVVTTGCSAGSLGSIGWVPWVMQRYSHSDNHQFGDSFVGALTEQLYDEAFPSWGAYDFFAPFIPGLSPEDLIQYNPNFGAYVYTQTANYFPQFRFSQYNSNYDSTQTAFYTIGGGTGGAVAWSQYMRSLISQIHAGTSNFDSYIGAGTQHCYIPYSDFYTLETQGQVLSDWVGGFTENRPALPPEVDCAPDCGTPEPPGAEPRVEIPRYSPRR